MLVLHPLERLGNALQAHQVGHVDSEIRVAEFIPGGVARAAGPHAKSSRILEGQAVIP